MNGRRAAGFSLGLVGVLAGCSASDGETSSSPNLSAPTVQRAATTLASPPATVASYASSLPGVAQWELHGVSNDPDFVAVGRDARGAQVVGLSVAYAAGTDTGVAFWSDKTLALTFDAVRAAVRRDVSTRSALTTRDLVQPGARLVNGTAELVCGPAYGASLDGLGCGLVMCVLSVVFVGAALPLDVLCGACGAAMVGGLGTSAVEGCENGEAPPTS